MIITLESFNSYINNWEDGEEMRDLKKSIISAAEEVVCNYVGYNPYSHLVESEYHTCSGRNRVELNDANPQSIQEAYLRGRDVSDCCTIRGGALYYKGLQKGDEIEVTYTAGWERRDIPAVFANTILRIASLMFAETGGAIGLTGRTSPDGSKSYINYTNYSKYLSNLDPYKRRFL